MIAVIGAAGTIGRNVLEFLESWAVPAAARDFRLQGDGTLTPVIGIRSGET